ncbi:MAG: hypothetical protein ACYDH5_14065 [Acidimicrobiales bacterium]
MDQLTRRLRAAATVSDEEIPELPGRVLRCLAAEVMTATDPLGEVVATGRRRRVRRHRRALIGGAAAIALASLPAAAAAGVFGPARTGGPPYGTSHIPGVQYLNVSTPRVVPIVRRLTRTVPLPRGSSWQPFLARYPVPTRGKRYRGTETTLAGVGGSVEWYARCQWYGAWLSAHDTGNAPAANRAAKVIGQAATWPFTVRDASPGVLSSLKRTAAAAEQGNASTIRQQWGLCTGQISPIVGK